MRRSIGMARFGGAAALLLVLAACQAGPPATPTPEFTPEMTPEASPLVTPEPTPTAQAGPVNTLEGVKSAVIQIEATGSFADPQVGEVHNVAGRGSGFIIDPSGIAVTNNHVVTGAALLRVHVAGENQPRSARVLGVSECSDLAVIQIDGDGFPYLDWHSGDIGVGLDVYAAGFPLGDPEFTLTRGIVAKERADGNTPWASVDYTIQHDAATNPGNSGGPIVTADGRVVAVHYAGDRSVIQQFAIGREEALRVIPRLREGEDVNSIGVNGLAVNDGQGLSGIWVYSVKSGSPADRAGVRGGDIITKLENLVLATNGTMADYCGILKSHRPGDVLAIEVLRFATQEVLEGQLNGRELTQKFSFRQEVPVEPSVPQGPSDYSGYVEVLDDTRSIVVGVPVEWRDVDGSLWTNDAGEVVGAKIVAAASIARFDQDWQSGIFLGASRQLAAGTNVTTVLGAADLSADCGEYLGRYEYDDAGFVGEFDFYADCGARGSAAIVLAAMPPDDSFLVLLIVAVASDADWEVADQALGTFNVIGPLP